MKWEISHWCPSQHFLFFPPVTAFRKLPHLLHSVRLLPRKVVYCCNWVRFDTGVCLPKLTFSFLFCFLFCFQLPGLVDSTTSLTSTCEKFHAVFFFFSYLSAAPPFVVIRLLLPLAVEIKVIKDLPWPPPVGQLNSSPPLVEELESPSQTAQPSPGQAASEQHQQGGCWCSTCPTSVPLTPGIHHFIHSFTMYPSIHPPFCYWRWWITVLEGQRALSSVLMWFITVLFLDLDLGYSEKKKVLVTLPAYLGIVTKPCHI